MIKYMDVNLPAPIAIYLAAENEGRTEIAVTALPKQVRGALIQKEETSLLLKWQK